MAEPLEVTVNSTNQRMGYMGALRSLPPITIDYIPPHGDGKGYLPLELLLMSLASCSGATVAFLLRRKGKSVSKVNVSARGIRRDRPPMSFEKIFLEFTLTTGDAREEDI